MPQCVVEFFRLTDGQLSLNDGGFGGLVFGLKLMSIDEIAVMAASWKSVHQQILKLMPVERVAEPKLLKLRNRTWAPIYLTATVKPLIAVPEQKAS